MAFHLTIGNKAYSSWSLRPWILLTHFGIPFDETVIPLHQPGTRAAIGAASPNGRVPVLDADGLVISESLAIVEFVAEAFPDLPIWPRDRAARATARALSSEIHAGFQALRQACPTNFRREPKPVSIGPEVRGRHRSDRGGLARCPPALRAGGGLPVRRLLGGRCHVGARGQPLPGLRGRRPARDPRLYGGRNGLAGLAELDCRGEGRAMALGPLRRPLDRAHGPRAAAAATSRALMTPDSHPKENERSFTGS